MTDDQWFVFDVNPYPWKVPPFSPGRKGNKIFVVAGRDSGLHTYKETIKEQLAKMPHTKIEGPVSLSLWFYRNVPSYKTQSGRIAKKHVADTTNLQKAAEDALQGFLFDNDTLVEVVYSHRVEQSADAHSLLVVRVAPFDNRQPVFPPDVQRDIDKLLAPYDPSSTSTYIKPEDVPF